MNKKLKKMLFVAQLVMGVVLLAGSPIQSYACVVDAASDDYENGNNIGVSFDEPWGGEKMTRDVVPPSNKNQYVNNMEHSFGGEAQSSTLYTNYCFHGVKSIYFTVRNYAPSNLKMSLYERTELGFKSVRDTRYISPSSGYYEAGYYNLNPKHYYYIAFDAPSDFSGTVKGTTY